jgi:two-component system sensor histidine kinase UhpB
MRSRTLLTQVLAVNAALVALTAALAAMLTNPSLQDALTLPGLAALAISVLLVILLNSLLLRHRLEPFDRLVKTMHEIDLAKPGLRASVQRNSAREIKELTAGFNTMLERLEEERKAAGRAVVRAQEQERAQIAQDLHDEVNQALTAIKLRLMATVHDAPASVAAELREVRALVDRAMDELLAIARALRPTALDDHGLVAALRSQVTDFGERTGIQTAFHRHGELGTLTDEEQLVIYRVTQESLSNVAHHAAAKRVDVDLSFTGNTILKVADDGLGFDALGAHRNGKLRGRPGGLGLNGMRERALLVGGDLHIFSKPGEGTTVELTMGAR